LQELEDFYLPLKRRKKPRPMLLALEPLAKIIMAQGKDDVDFLSTKYLNEKRNQRTAALQGARYIVAEQD
jgi:uncharacterized protein